MTKRSIAASTRLGKISLTNDIGAVDIFVLPLIIHVLQPNRCHKQILHVSRFVQGAFFERSSNLCLSRGCQQLVISCDSSYSTLLIDRLTIPTV